MRVAVRILTQAIRGMISRPVACEICWTARDMPIQLGLKLEPAITPLDQFGIGSIKREPTEN
jgi:hypothetical protein